LYEKDKLCIEDSSILDPDWYYGSDDFPDPKFVKGGTCDVNSTPNPYYKNHEVCEGGIECDYPLCTFNHECGTDGWISDYFCENDYGTYKMYRNYTCINPGGEDSNCSYVDTPILLQSCTDTQRCYLGECKEVSCFNNTDCGSDGYLGAYCTDTGVYDDYRTWSCNNNGTALSTCSHADREDHIDTCTNDEICVYGNCLPKDFFILGTFMDGDSEKELRYNVSDSRLFFIKIPKHAEIRNATIKIEGGKR